MLLNDGEWVPTSFPQGTYQLQGQWQKRQSFTSQKISNALPLPIPFMILTYSIVFVGGITSQLNLKCLKCFPHRLPSFFYIHPPTQTSNNSLKPLSQPPLTVGSWHEVNMKMSAVLVNEAHTGDTIEFSALGVES